MNLRLGHALTIAMVFTALAWSGSAASGQDSAADSQEAARRKIIESDRWQQVHRKLNQWLSVQKIYTQDEIASMRAKLADRIAKMSPRELEELVTDMEQRVEVLMSPEAEDARSWLGQYLAVVRDPEERLKSMRPDVAHMTAAQIRQELHNFQAQRTARRQAQASFDRTRMQQVQSLTNTQAASASSAQQAQTRTAATFGGDSPARSQYAPVPRNPRRPLPPPSYGLGPWGGPLTWYPARGLWW